MSVWLEALRSLGAFAICAGILAWLARQIIKHVLSKDIDTYRAQLAAANAREIERLRAELRIAAAEREVTFSVLQNRRADIVGEVYARMHEVKEALREFEPGVQPAEPLSNEELFRAFNQSFSDFMHYFGPREIYFPPGIADDVRELALGIANAADLRSWAYGMDWAAGLDCKKRWQCHEESRDLINGKVEPLLAAVRTHFRKLIGVVDE